MTDKCDLVSPAKARLTVSYSGSLQMEGLRHCVNSSAGHPHLRLLSELLEMCSGLCTSV